MLLPRDFLVLICICLVFVCCCKFTYQTSKDTEQEISGQCFVSDEDQCSGEEKLKYSQGIYKLMIFFTISIRVK